MLTFAASRTLDTDDMGSPEFDHVYRLTLDAEGRGYVTDTRADGSAWGYAPTAEHDDTADMVLDGTPHNAPAAEWHALTGHTGQYGYTGPVQHPSELWSRCHVEDLERIVDAPDYAAGLLFAVVAVEAPCTPEAPCFPEDPAYCEHNGCAAEPAGWAIVYRPNA